MDIPRQYSCRVKIIKKGCQPHFLFRKSEDEHKIHANLLLENGKVVTIANCGKNCHVWMEIDPSAFEEEDIEIDHGIVLI